MPVWTTKINGRRYELEVGPGKYDFALDKESKSIAFFWVRATQYRNIMWVRIINFGWGWPPIRMMAAFTDTDS